jgi:hypothetical protein
MCYQHADPPHPLSLLRVCRRRPEDTDPPKSAMNSRRLIACFFVAEDHLGSFSIARQTVLRVAAVTDAICLPARAAFDVANRPDGNSVPAL